MTEVRCGRCRKLLAKKCDNGQYEIKYGNLYVKTSSKAIITCPNCGANTKIVE